MYERSHAILDAVLGAEHPNTKTVLKNLTNCQQQESTNKK